MPLPQVETGKETDEDVLNACINCLTLIRPSSNVCDTQTADSCEQHPTIDHHQKGLLRLAVADFCKSEDLDEAVTSDALARLCRACVSLLVKCGEFMSQVEEIKAHFSRLRVQWRHLGDASKSFKTTNANILHPSPSYVTPQPPAESSTILNDTKAAMTREVSLATRLRRIHEMSTSEFDQNNLCKYTFLHSTILAIWHYIQWFSNILPLCQANVIKSCFL